MEISTKTRGNHQLEGHNGPQAHSLQGPSKHYKRQGGPMYSYSIQFLSYSTQARTDLSVRVHAGPHLRLCVIQDFEIKKAIRIVKKWKNQKTLLLIGANPSLE